MHPSSTSPPPGDVSDDDPFEYQLGKEKRKRSSRACDQCRKTKSKCDRPPETVSCRNCLALNQECTYLGPSRKRGPPKGYITSLENRVHRLEALWGAFLSCRDIRVESLVEDLAQDDLARDILSEVENGPFGPTGRYRLLQSHRESDSDIGPGPARAFTSSRAKREQYTLGNGEHRSIDRLCANVSNLVPPDQDPSLPSYRWQDILVAHLLSRGVTRKIVQSAEGHDISAPYAFSLEDTEAQPESEPNLKFPPVRRTLLPSGSSPFSTSKTQNGAEMIWRALYDPDMPSSGEESEYDSDDPADAVGQLSLNEKEEVGYHGKTSGMHILAKPHRSDSLNAGGLWRLPQSRFLPKSIRRRPMIEEDFDFRIQLPRQQEQDYLLQLYWTNVQPILPVLDKAKFLAEYTAERTTSAPESVGHPQPAVEGEEAKPQRVPRLLLLSMFTVAARYANDLPQNAEGNKWDAGGDFLDDAKSILNWTYDSPRPSTCQALILLAYREFGIGAISQAWVYLGMAMRMATDLGMHRAADKWQRSGRVLFSPAEKSCRKRVWCCCVILDRIMAFAMGRPMSIRERDYDTILPSPDEEEEMEPWTPMPPNQIPPRPVRTLSSLNAASSLSSILALVMDTTYACRSGVSFVVRHQESFKISSLLEDWYAKMPQHLRYNMDADQTVPLPHVLTLHMMYWCVMLLVHRPFIRHHKHTLSSSIVPEEEISRMSAQSLARSAFAASQVSSLVHVYCRSWDVTHANAFISWFVFSAGVMHVASLTMGIGNQAEAQVGLQRCLEAFDRMKVIWPSCARAWQLLHGAHVDLSAASRRNVPRAAFPQQPGHIYTEYSEHSSSATPTPSMTYSRRTYAPPSTPVARAMPSLTSALGQGVQGPPPNMSYFPGYNYWPPESLVFDPPFIHDVQTQEAHDDRKVTPTEAYDLPASVATSGIVMPTDYNLGQEGSRHDPGNPQRSWHW